jgi:hypothetical protein
MVSKSRQHAVLGLFLQEAQQVIADRDDSIVVVVIVGHLASAVLPPVAVEVDDKVAGGITTRGRTRM